MAYKRLKYSIVIDNRDIDYFSKEMPSYERHFPESSKSIPPRIYPIIYIGLINSGFQKKIQLVHYRQYMQYYD